MKKVQMLHTHRSFYRDNLFSVGDEHVLESYDDVVNAAYSGSHWLATFLLRALVEREAAYLRIADAGGKSP